MSLPTGAEFAEAGMQEAAVVSGAGSSAGVALPKLPSWGASGWQALFKQPSAGACSMPNVSVWACMSSVTLAVACVHASETVAGTWLIVADLTSTCHVMQRAELSASITKRPCCTCCCAPHVCKLAPSCHMLDLALLIEHMSSSPQSYL